MRAADFPDEKMEQVIFKVPSPVGGAHLTVCVSFYPQASGIDSLFDDAMKILCSELAMNPEELSAKIGASAEGLREKIRLVAVKNAIARTISRGADPYEMVEYATDLLPELKKMRESDESYNRNKILKIKQGELLANFQKYGEALKIFMRYSSDNEVRFRMFLCRLAMQESDEASKIIEKTITGDVDEDLYNFMVFLYECYVTKDLQKFTNELQKRTEAIKDPFIVTMLLRIKNLIADVKQDSS